MSGEEPIDRYLQETRGQRAMTAERPGGSAMNRNEAIMRLEIARAGIEALEADTRAAFLAHAEERDQLQAQLDAAQTDFEQLVRATQLRAAELQAQLDAERQGALAREEALEEARELVRRCYRVLYALKNGRQEVEEGPALMNELEALAWVAEEPPPPHEEAP